MTDWTTKVISDNIEIDLHPDLDCFPAQIRDKINHGNVLLTKRETYKLMLALIEYHGGVYSTG